MINATVISDWLFVRSKIGMWATKLGMSSAEARRRWTCLRDRYSRELKQLRSHPEKGDFGNNNFFRQMDFLRSFVRKRRARRKYDSSWDGSINERKIHMKVSVESEDMDDKALDESTQNYEKLEMVEAVTEAEEYPEYVEDSNDFEEFVEHQTTSNSSYASKPITNLATTPVPIMLHQQSLNGTTIYALTSTKQDPSHFAEKQLNEFKAQALTASSPATITTASITAMAEPSLENEDDFFCKSIGGYLRQLSRRYKIKAKVEMFQILEKYIELEENSNAAAQREKKS